MQFFALYMQLFVVDKQCFAAVLPLIQKVPCDLKEMVLFVDKANVAYLPKKVASCYKKTCVFTRKTANPHTDLKPKLKKKLRLCYTSLCEGNIA